MAKRVETGGGSSGAPGGQQPASRTPMGLGRLLGIALICLLVVVAGYLVWTFASSRGTVVEMTPETASEEFMAIQSARRGFTEALDELNEERVAQGKKPIIVNAPGRGRDR